MLDRATGIVGSDDCDMSCTRECRARTPRSAARAHRATRCDSARRRRGHFVADRYTAARPRRHVDVQSLRASHGRTISTLPNAMDGPTRVRAALSRRARGLSRGVPGRRRWSEHIEWAANTRAARFRQMGIPGGARNAHVSEQDLDAPNVFAGLETINADLTERGRHSGPMKCHRIEKAQRGQMHVDSRECESTVPPQMQEVPAHVVGTQVPRRSAAVTHEADDRAHVCSLRERGICGDGVLEVQDPRSSVGEAFPSRLLLLPTTGVADRTSVAHCTAWITRTRRRSREPDVRGSQGQSMTGNSGKHSERNTSHAAAERLRSIRLYAKCSGSSIGPEPLCVSSPLTDPTDCRPIPGEDAVGADSDPETCSRSHRRPSQSADAAERQSRE